MAEKQPIAAFRVKAGLTVEQVAEKLGVDRTTVFRWERGEPHIPVKRLETAAELFGATKRDLRPDIFEGA